MRELEAIKNSKTNLSEHIFGVFRKGERIGTLIRIEAVSFNKYPHHEIKNPWDIFIYFDKDEDIMKERELSVGISPFGFELARFAGKKYTLLQREYIPTPLGLEYEDIELDVSPTLFRHADNTEILLAKKAAKWAVERGFGPHGEIRNAEKLLEWAITEDIPAATSLGAMTTSFSDILNGI